MSCWQARGYKVLFCIGLHGVNVAMLRRITAMLLVGKVLTGLKIGIVGRVRRVMSGKILDGVSPKRNFASARAGIDRRESVQACHSRRPN